MSALLALAGDSMLGRGVAEVLSSNPTARLFSDEIVEITNSADLCVLNLECCISERGERWPAPGKPFFFRAPPDAVAVLVELGVDCVTLANNHALDFGHVALLDTFEHLDRAGIEYAGAGPNLERARAPVEIGSEAFTLTVVAATDHPDDFEAHSNAPGVALADVRNGLPDWVTDAIRSARGDAVLVTPHWGPNMTTAPLPEIKNAAATLLDTEATLIAGHSAHVFHGVADRVLYDLGDFVDDYAIDPILRNDLSLLWLVRLGDRGPEQLEAVPIKLEYCFTRLADKQDARWIEDRFRRACASFNTPIEVRDGRLHVTFSPLGHESS